MCVRPYPWRSCWQSCSLVLFCAVFLKSVCSCVARSNAVQSSPQGGKVSDDAVQSSPQGASSDTSPPGETVTTLVTPEAEQQSPVAVAVAVVDEATVQKFDATAAATAPFPAASGSRLPPTVTPAELGMTTEQLAVLHKAREGTTCTVIVARAASDPNNATVYATERVAALELGLVDPENRLSCTLFPKPLRSYFGCPRHGRILQSLVLTSDAESAAPAGSGSTAGLLRKVPGLMVEASEEAVARSVEAASRPPACESCGSTKSRSWTRIDNWHYWCNACRTRESVQLKCCLSCDVSPVKPFLFVARTCNVLMQPLALLQS